MAVLTQRERAEIAQLEDRIARLRDERADLGDTDQAESGPLTEEITSLTKRKETLEANSRTTMITVAIEPRTMRILPRGNWLDDSGEIVEPAIPAFLPHQSVEDRRANRLDLARWIVSNENQQIDHVAQIAEIGAELKKYAKTFQQSNFVRDKRKR